MLRYPCSSQNEQYLEKLEINLRESSPRRPWMICKECVKHPDLLLYSPHSVFYLASDVLSGVF